MPPDVEIDLALGATIEARVAELLRGPRGVDIARTLVEAPEKTLRRGEAAEESSRGQAAVAALSALGGSVHTTLSLGETLGEGGMGIVHLATQATVGRHVAVKTLKPGAKSAEATLRILREAWVTGALDHPNVVPVYDVGIDETGSPIIVMKRIEGREWGQLIHAHDEILERFPVQTALDWNLSILGSVCNAVHFAHSRGILHRDLKPENVMIGAFGEVYLLDWGIAVSLRDDPTGRLPVRESSQEIVGTPHYMAPEMLLGESGKLSPRTDVYLLGAILFEIFAGRPPHDGRDLHAMISHILGGELAFPANMPGEVRDICAKAMEREPDDRYADADAFRRAVDEYVRHRGSRRLAAEARRSHDLLATSLRQKESHARGDEVARLLGECRFGYRAAITAWSENEDAKKGLDQALVEVIEHALEKGDLVTCETLLGEVSDKPEDLVRRVTVAAKAKTEHDQRLARLEVDHDSSIGTRTRLAIASVFGILWTTSPLLVWAYASKVGHEKRFVSAMAPLAFLILGIAAVFWARETIQKTLYNRHLIMTGAVYLSIQTLLGVGGEMGGFPVSYVHLASMLGWGLTYGILAVWAETWFAYVSVTCAVSFLVGAIFQPAIYALMSLDNLVFTIVMVRAWLPREDVRKWKAEGQRLLEARRG
jgi:serine/threonine-protein kinase